MSYFNNCPKRNNMRRNIIHFTMSKLIINPNECGYRSQILTRLGLPSGIYVCEHKTQVAGELLCNKSSEFPPRCPLKDGMPIITKSEHMIITDESKPKRRNRKNCLHSYVWKNENIFRCSWNYVKYPNCQGVNCGFYTETRFPKKGTPEYDIQLNRKKREYIAALYLYQNFINFNMEVKYYLIWSTIFKDSKIRIHTTLKDAQDFCKLLKNHDYDACVELDKNQFSDTTTGALLLSNPR
jgi:hypothetical protein